MPAAGPLNPDPTREVPRCAQASSDRGDPFRDGESPGRFPALMLLQGPRRAREVAVQNLFAQRRVERVHVGIARPRGGAWWRGHPVGFRHSNFFRVRGVLGTSQSRTGSLRTEVSACAPVRRAQTRRLRSSGDQFRGDSSGRVPAPEFPSGNLSGSAVLREAAWPADGAASAPAGPGTPPVGSLAPGGGGEPASPGVVVSRRPLLRAARVLWKQASGSVRGERPRAPWRRSSPGGVASSRCPKGLPLKAQSADRVSPAPRSGRRPTS